MFQLPTLCRGHAESHAVCHCVAQSLPEGGCWVCRLKHAGVDGSVESEVNRLWEKLLLSLVGERAAKPYACQPSGRTSSGTIACDTHSLTHRSVAPTA